MKTFCTGSCKKTVNELKGGYAGSDHNINELMDLPVASAVFVPWCPGKFVCLSVKWIQDFAFLY